MNVFKASIGTVFATPTGLKVGARGRVNRPRNIFDMMGKGERRKCRKVLARHGFARHAADGVNRG